MNETWRKRLLWLLVVLDAAFAAFIFARSLQPAEASLQESGLLLSLLRVPFPDITMHAVRKLAHFAEFFVLGGLLGLTFAVGRKPSVLWPLLIGALVAGTDELIQRFVEGRSGELRDAALDCAGVLSALLLVRLLVWLLQRRKKA